MIIWGIGCYYGILCRGHPQGRSSISIMLMYRTRNPKPEMCSSLTQASRSWNQNCRQTTKIARRSCHTQVSTTNVFIYLSALTVVASLLILGLSGATKKDTAGNHHHQLSPVLRCPFFFSFFSEPQSLFVCFIWFSEKQLWSEACWSMWNVGERSRRRALHFSQLPKQIPPRHRVRLHPWR